MIKGKTSRRGQNYNRNTAINMPDRDAKTDKMRPKCRSAKRNLKEMEIRVPVRQKEPKRNAISQTKMPGRHIETVFRSSVTACQSTRASSAITSIFLVSMYIHNFPNRLKLLPSPNVSRVTKIYSTLSQSSVSSWRDIFSGAAMVQTMTPKILITSLTKYSIANLGVVVGTPVV